MKTPLKLKYILSILLLSFAFFTKAQEGVTFRTDTVRKIQSEITNIKAWFADINGNDSIPGNYDIIIYNLYQPDKLVVITPGGKTPTYSSISGTIGNKFRHKRINSGDYMLDMIPKVATEEYQRPDSVFAIDYKAMEQFISDHKDSLKIDSIFILNQEVVDLNTNLIYKCSYKYKQKHGFEYAYYTVQELKGICVVDNFMLKYKGKWKNGQKNGIWSEYDKTGKLISEKKYKHGELIKEKTK